MVAPMKILLINPNTSVSVTERLTAAAAAVAAPGTEIIPLTAPSGVPYIASRAEAAVAAVIVLEMLAAHWHEADAAIIAAFGDPGLGGARELFPIPIVGMAEAAMLTACMLGRRFAIVSFTEALGAWYRECVEGHGLLGRLAAIRLLTGGFASIGTVQEEKADALVDLALRSISEDEADVIVLAGAPLAGLAHLVRDRITVPVVDGAAAALKQAEALASLGVRKGRAGTYKRPPAKPATGVAPVLARWIGHET
jgi:Asp/Glu/hydantoin racemase